jgi:hypothetical protein
LRVGRKSKKKLYNIYVKNKGDPIIIAAGGACGYFLKIKYVISNAKNTETKKVGSKNIFFYRKGRYFLLLENRISNFSPFYLVFVMFPF